MDLALADFVAIRDLLYARTGLMFEDKKKDFLAARVARRLAATHCATPQTYIRLLRTEPANGQEFQALVEQVTTNETYFFRDFPQLEGFANEVLPHLAEAKRSERDYRLNIWSACCSTGDEPYTLAIILAACLDDFSRWKVRLLATDIDTVALRTARAGLYGKRNLKDVPTPYLPRYFEAAGRDEFRVAENIRRMVKFQTLNLMDDAGMREQRGFDVVFCRNALIYFDDVSRRKVLNYFYEALLPGGLLYLGHSESVSRICSDFESASYGGVMVYRKPLTTRRQGGKK